MMVVKFKRLNSKARIPSKKAGDAGYDLFTPSYFKLLPLERKVIPLGFSIEIPFGYVGLIWDRSGHAAKQGIKVMAGVVDSTYRGEVGVVVTNLNSFDWLNNLVSCLAKDKELLAQQKFFQPNGTWEVSNDTAIAQMLFQKVEDVDFEEVEELSSSERGNRGLGSQTNQF